MRERDTAAYGALVAAVREAVAARLNATRYGEVWDADEVGDAAKEAIAGLCDAGFAEPASGPSDRSVGYGLAQFVLTRSRWARRLAEYAHEFEAGACGPDVDALAERFDELLRGEVPEGGGVEPERPHPCRYVCASETKPLDESDLGGVLVAVFRRPADSAPELVDWRVQTDVPEWAAASWAESLR